jgi:hypothetical protein
MYFISFTFLGIGLWKVKKDSDNKFYMSLLGCGTGAIYISLLVTNMYFKAISDIGLYILVLIWATGVCVLSRWQDTVFQIIGLVGISISNLLGCAYCIEKESISMYTAVVIFYLIASIVFYITHYNKELTKNNINHISNIVNISWLCIFGNEILSGNSKYVLIPLAVVCIVNLVLIFRSTVYESDRSFGFTMLGYSILICYIFYLIVNEPILVGLFMLIFGLALIVIVSFKKFEVTLGQNIAYITASGIAIIGAIINENEISYGFVGLLVFTLVIYGFVREIESLKYVAMIVFLFHSFAIGEYYVFHYMYIIAYIAVTLVLMYIKKEQYRKDFKTIVHVISVVALWIPGISMIRQGFSNSYDGYVVIYGIVSLFNIGLLKSPFSKNLETGEKEEITIFNVINLIAMMIGLVFINFDLSLGMHFLIIIFALITYMVNVVEILDDEKNMYGGIYVGLKFLILLCVILASFDAPNYVVSIGCFILAIISIVCGFKWNYKFLRIFGLIISMISTLKLIMVDITYDNTIGHAASFFIAGILCFAISMIYNYIDKKYKDEE